MKRCFCILFIVIGFKFGWKWFSCDGVSIKVRVRKVMLILIDIGEILISKVDIIYFGLGGFKI